MPSPAEIVTFKDDGPPPGMSPWVMDGPSQDVAVVPADPSWPQVFEELAGRIRKALGSHARQVEHVGSTAVPGLPAKPVIDIDLLVVDPDDEATYVPALEAIGFQLRVREPWWYQHRMLRSEGPRCNLHVFAVDSAEHARHRIFRDWLRSQANEAEFYAATKVAAAQASLAAGEDVMAYNARKQVAVRAIYDRAFRAAGLLS
jgi:GrpB-like predicted nucleotidyltransferase (UPF0157 family)